MPTSRAIAKALRLWGDPVVEKAAARGSNFGPTHVPLVNMGDGAFEVPPDVYDATMAKLNDIQNNTPLPKKTDGSKWTQKEANEYKASLAKPVWESLKQYAPTKIREMQASDFPQEMLEDFRDIRFNEIYEASIDYGLTHEDALKAAQEGAEKAKLLDNPRDVKRLEDWAYWTPHYKKTLENVRESLLKPGYTPPPQFETGKPVTVKAYHGSPKGDITEFKDEYLGQNTGANSAKLGHFFAGNPNTSDSYVGSLPDPRNEAYDEIGNLTDPEYEALREVFLNQPSPFTAKMGVEVKPGKLWLGTKGGHKPLGADTFIKYTQALRDPNNPFYEAARKTNKYLAEKAGVKLAEPRAPTTYPVMVNMKNPLVRDWKGGDYQEHSYSKFLREAKDAGHDSAVLMNTYDGGPQDNIFVSFEPKRIRSVNAAFDPANIDKADIMGNIDPKLLATMGAGSAAALTAGALRTGIPDVGTIEAAKNPMMGKIANLLRKVAKNPVAGTVLPLEGMADLADKYAYGDKRTFMDYFNANPL